MSNYIIIIGLLLLCQLNVCFCFIDDPNPSAYSNGFSWIRGTHGWSSSSIIEVNSTGIPTITNYPRGRYLPIFWRLNSKSYSSSMVFSGEPTSQTDLWEYNGTMWTNHYNQYYKYPNHGVCDYIFGNETLVPGGRQAGVGFEYKEKNYIFGGYGYDCDFNSTEEGTYGRRVLLNELWLVDFGFPNSTKQFYFIRGSFNGNSLPNYGSAYGVEDEYIDPGGRSDAVLWLNKNFAYIFGGQIYSEFYDDIITTNDMFRLNLETFTFSWISGSNLCCDNNRITTSSGVFSIKNFPAARASPVIFNPEIEFYNKWTINKYQNIGFMFAGCKFDGETYHVYNDFWAYNFEENSWAYFRGEFNKVSKYNEKGEFSSSTEPGSRCMTNGWMMPNNQFWISGGYGFAAEETKWALPLNDLFVFLLDENGYVWMHGNKTAGSMGVYGEMGGLKNSKYIFSSRYGFFHFIYPNQYVNQEDDSISEAKKLSVSIFGGYGKNVYGYTTYLQDTWKGEFIYFAPPSWFSTFGLIFFISLIGSSFLILIAISLAFLCYAKSKHFKVENLQYWHIFAAFLALCDFASDIYFILLCNNLSTQFYFNYSLIPFFSNFLINSIVLVYWVKTSFHHKKMNDWFIKFKYSFSIIFIFSICNLAFLRILRSGLLNFPLFSFPVNKSSQKFRISSLSFFTLFLKDIPIAFFILIVGLFIPFNYWPVSFWAIIFVKGITLLYGLLVPFIIFLKEGGGKGQVNFVVAPKYGVHRHVTCSHRPTSNKKRYSEFSSISDSNSPHNTEDSIMTTQSSSISSFGESFISFEGGNISKKTEDILLTERIRQVRMTHDESQIPGLCEDQDHLIDNELSTNTPP